MADRRRWSEDMQAENHQGRIDDALEAHGYRCLQCGETGMTEDDFISHVCPEPAEDDDEAPSDDPYCAQHGQRYDPEQGCPECVIDAEDARHAAHWNAEAERQRPPSG